MRRILLIAALLAVRLSADVSALMGVPITTDSNVMGVSPVAGVLGQPVVTGGLSPVFYWSFESATPEIGSYTSLPFEFGAARSTDQAFAGTYSLELDPAQTFSQVQVFNDTASDAWAPVSEGTLDFRWYYDGGTWPNGSMLGMIDGKSLDGGLDTNDGFTVKFTPTAGRLSITFAGNNGASSTTLNATYYPPMAAGYYRVRAAYNQAGPHTISATLNDQPAVFTTTALAAPVAAHWHHQSIGNDTATLITTFLDEYTVYPQFIDGSNYATTYLAAEEAEGTGTPSGWTDANTPNWDYTTTALKGSQSLAFTASNQSSYFAITDDTEIFVRFKWRVNNLAEHPNILTLQTSAGSQVLRWEARSTGGIRTYNADGSTISTSAGGTVAVDTTYTIWCHYRAGSGSNAVVETYVSTTDDRTDTFFQALTGTSTTQVGRVFFNGDTSTTTIVDNLLITEAPIGDGTLP